MLYPRLIEVSGRCPPEDCGGPWGYAELLEAIKDPKHERHAELTEWIGYDFDPDADDAEGLSAEVSALAKAWSRKPTSKRTRRRNPRPSPVFTGLHRMLTFVRRDKADRNELGRRVRSFNRNSFDGVKTGLAVLCSYSHVQNKIP